MERSRIGVFGISLTILSIFIGGVPGHSAQTGFKGSFEYTQGGTLQPVASPTVERTTEAKEVIEQISIVEHMIGRIDWENQIVYAVGEGVPPKDALSPAQARARAKRAAIDEAYAALLEAIQEVRVDAESTTRNFVNENRVSRNKVEGFVKNAEIDELKQFDDGSFQVKMKMPMVGKGGLSTALYPAQRSSTVQSRTVYTIKQSTTTTSQPTPSNPAPEKEPSKATPAPGSERSKEDPEKQSQKAPSISGREQAKAEQSYTGLIVDAKGLNTKPALYPNILTEGGQKVYDIATPNPNAAIEEGLVGYRKSLEEAKKLGRVGNSPLIVKAKQIGGKYGADIVLSEEDARQILEADGRGKFLGDAKVVVVID